MLRVKGCFVNVLDIFKIADCPPNKSVGNWLKLDTTKQIVNFLALCLSTDPKQLYKLETGTDANVWLHWFLAILYAQFVGEYVSLQVESFLSRQRTVDKSLWKRLKNHPGIVASIEISHAQAAKNNMEQLMSEKLNSRKNQRT